MPGSSLVGAWKLVALERTFDDGRVVLPYGDALNGFLIYSSEGWVSAFVMRADRKRLEPGQMTNEDRESILSTMTAAYQATYKVVGDKVIHKIRASLYPNMTGMEEPRKFTIDGDTLTVTTAPFQSREGLRVDKLKWQRVSADY